MQWYHLFQTDTIPIVESEYLPIEYQYQYFYHTKKIGENGELDKEIKIPIMTIKLKFQVKNQIFRISSW